MSGLSSGSVRRATGFVPCPDQLTVIRVPVSNGSSEVSMVAFRPPPATSETYRRFGVAEMRRS